MPKPVKSKDDRARLFFDIETSPNIGLFWRPGYKLTISHENIIHERSIICIGYKWANEKKVHCPTWDRNQSDKELLTNFVQVLNEADEIIAHNGDRFDITWIRTRCIKHGIPMMPNYTSIDTLKAAKNRFNFNSNKLDYISEYLGFGKKIKTDYDLWKRVLLDNDKKALKQMVTYCKHDVVLLEKVFDKMNPYLLPKTSIAGYVSDCPECGSSHTTVNKHRMTAAGYKKLTFRCVDCGKYHTVAESRFNKNMEL